MIIEAFHLTAVKPWTLSGWLGWGLTARPGAAGRALVAEGD